MIITNQDLKPTNDFIFKRIFTKEGNQELLLDFLEGILEEKIISIEIEQDVTLEKEIESNKLGVLDIKCTINNKEIVNVEMQVKNNKDMIERSLFYWSALYHNNLLKGEDYPENKKIIAINILLYDIFEEGPYKEVIKLKRNYKNKEATNKLEIYFIQMPKFLKEGKLQEGKLANWLYYISQDKRGLEKAMNENEKIKKAQEEYGVLTGDAYTRRLAELREKAIRDENSAKRCARKEGLQEGREQGIEQGIIKGEKEKEEKIVRNMLEKGIDIITIKEITGLTKEKIENIKNE